MLLEHTPEEIISGSSRADRANSRGRHPVNNLNALNEDGVNLTDTIVRELVEGAIHGAADG